MSHLSSKTEIAVSKEGHSKTYPRVAEPVYQRPQHYEKQSTKLDISKGPSHFPSITHEEEEINPDPSNTGNDIQESVAVQPGAVAIQGPGISETSSVTFAPNPDGNGQSSTAEHHSRNNDENLVIAAELSPDEDRNVLEERLAQLEDAFESAPVAEATAANEYNSNQKKKRCDNCFFKCCLPSAVVCIIVFVIIVAIAARAASSSGESTTLDRPTPAPTYSPMAILNGCPMKTVQVTHICNVPDLDDDIFGNDVTLDIKILIEDEVYWPQDVLSDCSSTYGSYKGSCVIPDTSLTGCFPLANSIQQNFVHPLPNTVSSRGSLKITIYDVDILSDDFIDILVPNSDWYDPITCEDYEFEATAEKNSARIKMTVTSRDSATPSASPTFTKSPAVTSSPTLSSI
mmetsp:Transcript_5482/g.8042  ORF Transcript_5482/g.8042 Transcript_5482/m.8042 type:complete len:401 (-) Transcript_5482:155-1357(-)